MTDENLINLLRGGDNNAVKKIYKSGFGYCASFVLKNSGTREDAKDVFQQAMIVLLEKIKDEDFKIKVSIKSFLYAVTRNLWLSDMRGRVSTNPIDNEKDLRLALDDEIEEKKLLESAYLKLEAGFEKLSEECKKLLKLFFYKRLSDREIAPLMDYTVDFVRNKRSRCIKTLRKFAA